MKFFILIFISFPVFGMTGKATYYTVASCQREGTSGIKTASGEKFDEQALTCAIRSRDFGSIWRVTNNANGKTIIVRHTDYGPGRKATANGVIIDLTPKGFELLGAGRKGMLNVTIECLKSGKK
jgi:rare lipoprotein A